MRPRVAAVAAARAAANAVQRAGAVAATRVPSFAEGAEGRHAVVTRVAVATEATLAAEARVALATAIALYAAKPGAVLGVRELAVLAGEATAALAAAVDGSARPARPACEQRVAIRATRRPAVVGLSALLATLTAKPCDPHR